MACLRRVCFAEDPCVRMDLRDLNLKNKKDLKIFLKLKIEIKIEKEAISEIIWII